MIHFEVEDLPPDMQEQALRKLGEQQPPPEQDKPRKYHNTPAERDGIRFDSQKEARRFDDLSALLRAGKIRDLKLQPQFTLIEAYTTTEGNHVRATRYQADFSYERATAPDCEGAVYWIPVVEDVKSKATRTRLYVTKKKMMLLKFGIEIREV